MLQDTPEQNTMQYNIPFNQNNCIPNCIQIAEHIRDCPICCKFYKNDNTVVAYRQYYLAEKVRFAKWKNGDMPNWFEMQDAFIDVDELIPF
jgi:hypothetical protein